MAVDLASGVTEERIDVGGFKIVVRSRRPVSQPRAVVVVCHGVNTAGSKDKTLRLYEGHYHDLLNDIGKEKVMADIMVWIDKHLA